MRSQHGSGAKRRAILGSALVLSALGIAVGLGMSGCSGAHPYPYLSEAGKRGYETYRICLMCHLDPHRDTSTGPPIAGSSAELLRAKVLGRDGRGYYPPGYEPKRKGSITMPVQPVKPEQIPDLAAFLSEVKPRE